jgi:3'(2'), 5'-bisphosphate nucleotidase
MADDHSLAAQLATGAGELLVDLRARRVAYGVAGRALGADGDAAAHNWLVEQLAELRPDDAVLSEEGLEDPRRLKQSRVWIVDPLDGTREFGEVPRPDWAVHVALVIDGEAAIGAVALPARKLTLATDPAPVVPTTPVGANASPTGAPRIVVSRSRPPIEASWVPASGRCGRGRCRRRSRRPCRRVRGSIRETTSAAHRTWSTATSPWGR